MRKSALLFERFLSTSTHLSSSTIQVNKDAMPQKSKSMKGGRAEVTRPLRRTVVPSNAPEQFELSHKLNSTLCWGSSQQTTQADASSHQTAVLFALHNCLSCNWESIVLRAGGHTWQDCTCQTWQTAWSEESKLFVRSCCDRSEKTRRKRKKGFFFCHKTCRCLFHLSATACFYVLWLIWAVIAPSSYTKRVSLIASSNCSTVHVQICLWSGAVCWRSPKTAGEQRIMAKIPVTWIILIQTSITPNTSTDVEAMASFQQHISNSNNPGCLCLTGLKTRLYEGDLDVLDVA